MDVLKNDIEELKNTMDSLMMECAKNSAHLKTLTKAFWEISHQFLDKDELANLQQNYYHTLYEKTSELLEQSGEALYHPAKVHFALLEMKQFVDAHLKEGL